MNEKKTNKHKGLRKEEGNEEPETERTPSKRMKVVVAVVVVVVAGGGQRENKSLLPLQIN